MTSYADEAYYFDTFHGTALPGGTCQRVLDDASRHIDVLTYGRINRAGFSNLSSYQQETIQNVVCRQAEFEYENSDMINQVLSGYAINGVSMNFGESWNLKVQDGVAIRRDVYAMLEKTGLCWGGL